MARRIAVLTTGRQDWGILRSLCLKMKDDLDFELCLIVGGMHLSPRFGMTAELIEQEGFQISERVDWIDESMTGMVYEEAGRALDRLGDTLDRLRPEALILVGDRFETAAAAIAATLARVPIVHLHGGEETEGAFDNALRHAITKLSHLHLTSHPDHAARVIAMGEDPASVHVVGAPGLDNLNRDDLPERGELEDRLGIMLEPPIVIVTLHPATLGGDPGDEAEALAAAMDLVGATYVITLPNSDPGNDAIRTRLAQAAGAEPRVAVEALGERNYWGLMKLADAMVGNSSSALIEAPAIGLPAVNIGDRQKGRVRGGNVIDTSAKTELIADALRTALSPEFREKARQASSPFGNGRSAEKIVEILRGWHPPVPPVKRFWTAA